MQYIIQMQKLKTFSSTLERARRKRTAFRYYHRGYCNLRIVSSVTVAETHQERNTGQPRQRAIFASLARKSSPSEVFHLPSVIMTKRSYSEISNDDPTTQLPPHAGGGGGGGGGGSESPFIRLLWALGIGELGIEISSFLSIEEIFTLAQTNIFFDTIPECWDSDPTPRPIFAPCSRPISLRGLARKPKTFRHY
jgi:hypothetical protein